MRAFWQLPLTALDHDEWEALCDGCAKCCYVFDTATGEQTTRPCKLLVGNRCSDYRKRFVRVGLQDGYRCHKVTIPYIETGQLPDSCAYVRRYKGEPLEAWQIEKAHGNYCRNP